METILIERFGLLAKAEIEVKDINVFIGTTSSGKSIAAKLISIFKRNVMGKNITFRQFEKALADYNIDFDIENGTRIRYEFNDVVYEVTGRRFESGNTPQKVNGHIKPIYIPAERIFFPMISQSIFGLISSDISLPKWFLDFGAHYEKARNSLKKFQIDFLPVAYEYNEGADYITIRNGLKVKLSKASSGLQSVIPLILVIQHYNENDGKSRNMFVIEEPELNLYPSSQKGLVEFIIRSINRSQNKLIITTHSPYLLTALDNLIQANNAAKESPGHEKEIDKLVPEPAWVDFNKVSCYYFDEGTCRTTLDGEMRSIGPSNIDDVSIRLSKTFEDLLALKYPS